MTTHDDNPLRNATPGQATGWTPPNPHAEEAQQRWGHTDAWKQSQERVKNMTREQFAAIGAEAQDIVEKLAALAAADAPPADAAVQEQIARHYNSLRHFYEPDTTMYRGLADMYVADPRFTATYDKTRPGLAVFIHDAMHVFCDAQAGA